MKTQGERTAFWQGVYEAAFDEAVRKPGPLVCPMCGALVADRSLHAGWHAGLQGLLETMDPAVT